MNYIFLNLKDKNKELILLECIKVDSKFNKLEAYKKQVKITNKMDGETVIQLINFVKGSILIGHNLPNILIGFLTQMYNLKIYDCTFWYFDIKDYIDKDIDYIDDMIKLMKDYSDNNLDNIKYVKNKGKAIAFRLFRGLNYKLYLLDNGYYIYDKGIDKKASFYIHKKELSRDWNYSEEEYLYLKNNGATFITNIFHISDDTIKYCNEYTVYSNNNLEDYPYMINKIENALLYLDDHPELNIKLVCIGTINEFKQNYKILGEDKINRILGLIKREKELWSQW